MEFTGERFVPEEHGAIELEHLHRYLLAKEIATDKIVLDIASGEGYGSYMLSKVARKVIGVDISTEAVNHAKGKYLTDNLEFLVGSCAAIPLLNNSVDVVVSYETIEHHNEHEAMMEEIKRVLKPDGCLIISSPDKLEYSDKPVYNNPHHVKELYRDEFKNLLSKYFCNQYIYGQRIAYGSAIMAENSISEIATYQLNEHIEEPYLGIANAVYLIATASDVVLPSLRSGFLEESVNNSEEVQLGMHKIELLKSQFDNVVIKLANDTASWNSSHAEFDRKLAELDRQLAERDEQLAERDRQQAELNKQLAERDSQLAERDSQLAKRDEQLVLLHQHIAAVSNSSSWRITAPLRFTSRQVKRVPRIIKLALPSIKLGGGFSSTLKKAVKLYRQEGIAGIKRGFRLAALSVKPAAATSVAETATSELSAIIQNEVPDAKENFKQQASAELNDFLKSNQRLVFRNERAPLISIIIIVWNSAHLTYKCLKALLDEQTTNECPAFEVIIFNNASSDLTAEFLARVDGIHVINSDENIGFLLGCNQAANSARGEAILLLNSDAFVRQGALHAAYTTLCSRQDIGAVGGRIILPSGVLQEAGSIVWADGSTVGYCRGAPVELPAAMYRRQVDYCSGAFLMTPSSVWRDLQGFDESYVPAYYEEVDYCMRLHQHGLIVMYEPWAVIDHFEFGSEKKQGDSMKLMLRNRERIVITHQEWLGTKAWSPSESNLLKACNVAAPKVGRLLVFDDQVPFTALGAGLPRMRALLNFAAENGWQVTFFAMLKRDFKWEHVRREFNPEIEFVTDVPQENIESFLKARSGLFDTILISRPLNMKVLNDCFDHCPELLNESRLIYDAEAVFSLRDMLLSKIKGDEKDADFYAKAIDEEVAIGRYADAITCVSQAESLEFSKRLTAAVTVLNHAIATSAQSVPFQDRFGFLFVGVLLEAHSPNRMGLAWFVKQIWPKIRKAIPHASLQVVGHISPEHDDILSEGVIIRGAVDDLEEVYNQARVFIAPVQFAAGIPIKVIEAAAAGLPVIGTQLMTRQLGWTSGVEIQDADDPIEFAEKAVKLHNHHEAWIAQSNLALNRVKVEFSSAGFCERLLSVLDPSINPKK